MDSVRQSNPKVNTSALKSPLFPQERVILCYLQDQAPRVVSVYELVTDALARGWYNPATDPALIRVHIHHIRRTLGPDVIITHRGHGYRAA